MNGLGEVRTNVSGLNTYDATACKEHILKDYTAYSKGKKITGNLVPKKHASGVIVANNENIIEVNNLGFKPKIVVAIPKIQQSQGSSIRQTIASTLALTDVLINYKYSGAETIFTDFISVQSMAGSTMSSSFTEEQYVDNDGFRLPVSLSGEYEYFAFE